MSLQARAPADPDGSLDASSPWPRTDLLAEVRTSQDGAVVEADTTLYLQGTRTHVHTSTILLAVDHLLSRLLDTGERLPDIEEMQYRNLSGHDMRLMASAARARIPHVGAPAVRAVFRTDRGRALFVEGVLLDRPVRRRCAAAGILDVILGLIHAEGEADGVHTTRVDPLPRDFLDGTDPVLARHAIVQIVLEGTRLAIRRRLKSQDGLGLVVAGWKGFAFPRWRDVALGCALRYSLSDAALSSGTELVHCDFSFSRGPAARLTVARIPGARTHAPPR